MTDVCDDADSQSTPLLDASISAIRDAAAHIPKGERGICSQCEEHSPRLVNGLCAPCRDRIESFRRRTGRK